MPTIQVPTSELLRAVRQLSPAELEEFTAEVLALRHQRLSPGAEASEEQLLEAVREDLPEQARARYADLRARRRAGTLTPQEQAELLQITTEVEHRNVSRMQALAALARLRGVSLTQVMDQLGIKAPPYE
jgi:hypothetical protein